MEKGNGKPYKSLLSSNTKKKKKKKKTSASPQVHFKMHFFQLTSALALATAANAAASASTMQSNIDHLTTLSSDTHEIAK